MRKLAIVALAAAALAASSAMSGPGELGAPIDHKCAVTVFYHSMSPDRPRISITPDSACDGGAEAAVAVTLATLVRANHLPDGTPR